MWLINDKIKSEYQLRKEITVYMNKSISSFMKNLSINMFINFELIYDWYMMIRHF